jgi:hypothetical protein
MSLVSSARRNEFDIFVSVRDVLDRLLAGETNYDDLRPDVWKQSHPEAMRIHRVEERQARAAAKAVKRAPWRWGALPRASPGVVKTTLSTACALADPAARLAATPLLIPPDTAGENGNAWETPFIRPQRDQRRMGDRRGLHEQGSQMTHL